MRRGCPEGRYSAIRTRCLVGRAEYSSFDPNTRVSVRGCFVADPNTRASASGCLVERSEYSAILRGLPAGSTEYSLVRRWLPRSQVLMLLGSERAASRIDRDTRVFATPYGGAQLGYSGIRRTLPPRAVRILADARSGCEERRERKPPPKAHHVRWQSPWPGVRAKHPRGLIKSRCRH